MYAVRTYFCTVLQIFALFWVMFGINCTRINQSQPRNISLYIITYDIFSNTVVFIVISFSTWLVKGYFDNINMIT